jgi:hypothetical protein
MASVTSNHTSLTVGVRSYSVNVRTVSDVKILKTGSTVPEVYAYTSHRKHSLWDLNSRTSSSRRDKKIYILRFISYYLV